MTKTRKTDKNDLIDNESQKQMLSDNDYKELYEIEKKARLEHEEENEFLKRAKQYFKEK